MERVYQKRFPANSKDYKLYEDVGEGVSATVYRALCVPLNEIVAIKVLDLEKCNNDLSQLNGALMRVVNGKGNIFLAAITSSQDYSLQLLLDEGSNPDEAWNEIRMAARVVISKLCKNFCPCRSDLTAHVH